jgi:hypothetical protein
MSKKEKGSKEASIETPEVKAEVTGFRKVPTKAAKQSPPLAAKPKIDIRVFMAVGGMKQDQLAGFKHFAKATGLKSMTVPEWKKAHSDFLNRPTK